MLYTMTQPPPLRIATRRSDLAVAQARLIGREIGKHLGHEVELVRVTSTGDREAHRPLREIGGKGVFVKALEVALLEKRADLAVHSLKDVPSRLAPQFTLAAIGWRDDARDALISCTHQTLQALPPGARMGTSSLRRKLLLERLRPDLEVLPMRGNVKARLARLKAGEYQALVLSVAGLKRLGLLERACHIFSTDQLLPAPGQGMLGVEVLTEREDLVSALSQFTSHKCDLIGRVERRVSELLQGDCRLPIATYAEVNGKEARLRVWIASVCGQLQASVTLADTLELSLAERAVDQLLANGGEEVMATFRESR